MTAPAITGLDSVPSQDVPAIGKTLQTLLDGFRRRDANALRAVYSIDADWVNAFGSVKRGRDEIVNYLQGLFSDSNFDAGTLEGPPQSSIRMLGADVAVVSTHLRITGQLRTDGTVIEIRDNFSMRVLHREDGSWPVVSEMYMDARTDQSYVGHS